MKILTTVKGIKKELFTCVFGVLILLNPVFGQSDTLQSNSVANGSVHYLTPKLSQPDIQCVTPPEGFVKSEAFNGYIHFQTSSTILIQYIENATYLQIADGIDDEFFKRNNLTFISKEAFKTDDGINGLIYVSKFKLKETDFYRYMVYLGDLNNTLWLNITYPEMVEGIVKDLMITSIKSSQFKLAKNEK